jgi:hypothetical protein
MTRYLESGAARNEEDGSARVLESGAAAGVVDLAGTTGGLSTATGTLSTTGAAGGLPITETWTGSNGTPWPTPKWSITKAWPQYVVTDTIQGNRGRLVVGDVPYAFGLAELADSTHTDVEITFTYAIGNATRESYTEVFYRMDHTGTIGEPPSSGWPIDCYAIDIEPQINTVFLANLDAGGIGTNIATVASAGVNVTSDIKFRILVVGSNHKVRWWPATGTEPSTWQIDLNDSTWTSGHFALGLYEGDYVGGSNQAEFDDLRVAAPTTPTTLMKGVGAIPDANTAIDLDTLNVSWWYEWDNQTTHAHVSPPGYQFVPMMWGDWDRTYPGFDIGGTPAEAIGDSSILLGFNEPNIPSQSDMTVARCLELWPQMEATGARLGSPALSPNGGQEAYLDAFFAGNPRVDFLCLHWYPEYDAGYPNIGNYLDHYHTRYGLPIWLTEITAGTTGSIADSAALITTTMAACEARPWVERIAWFFLARDPGAAGWPNSSLINSDGSLNAAGTVYASYPPGEIPPDPSGPVPLVGTSSGVSTTTGSLAVTKPLVAVASAGVSTATGNMVVSHTLVAVTPAGSSTTTATMAVARALVGTAAGLSTTVGAMARAVPLSGASGGLSSDTGVSAVAVALSGSSTGTSTATGDLGGASSRALAGQTDGSSSTMGSLSVAVALTGQSVASSTATAAMAKAAALVGTSAGLSTTTGALARAVPLAGSAAGLSTTTGNMVVAKALAGSTGGLSTTTGAMARAVPLTGTSAGLSTTTGASNSVIALSGTSAGSSQTQGLMDGTAATPLVGTAAGSSTTTGAMAVAKALVGTAAGTSTTTAASTVAHALLGVPSNGNSSATGAMAVARSLVGTTAGGSTTTGALVGSSGMGGSSAGSSTTTGTMAGIAKALSGSSTGTSTATGSLTSQAPNSLSGAAAGSSTTTGNLGVAMRLPSASAAGSSTTTGTLSRSVPLAGNAVPGTSTATGSMAVARGMVGASAGGSTAVATARVAVALVGMSDGQSTVIGRAATAIALAGFSVGTAASSGTLQVFFIAPVYGIWNGQPFDAMQYGDKVVTAWMLVPS